jgi:hypothetical protein
MGRPKRKSYTGTHKSVIVLEQKQKNETEWNQSFEDNKNKHIADWLESDNYVT